MAFAERQQLHHCFVLHRRDYGNTSLIVEVFSRNFGRFPAIAKSAKKPRNMAAALLQPFQALWLHWGGRGEVKTLYRIEALGPAPRLAGTVLFCGFYLNELLMRLVGRDDPHEQLFEYYQDALAALVGSDDLAGVLRRFELHLLQEIGYAILLDQEADSARPVDPGRRYRYELERGPVVAAPTDRGFTVAGQTLLCMAQHQPLRGAASREARHLMRQVIARYLGDKPLKSRELLRETLLKQS